MSSNSTRIAKNTGYLYMKTIVSMLVMLFVTRMILHALGTIDYGIYSVVAGAIAILGFFKNSLAITMQRFLNHYQGENNFEKQRQVFSIGVYFHWIVAFVLVILLLLFSLLLFNGILSIPEDRYGAAKIVYLCLIVNTFLTVVSAPYDATITAHENMLYYSLVGIFEAFLKLIIALVIVDTSGDRLVLYSILMMIIPVISMLLLFFYCKKKYKECSLLHYKRLDKLESREMVRFAGLTIIGSSTNVVGNHGANLTLNHFFGASINAVAGIASQIQGVLAVLFTGLMKSMTPVIFKFEGAGNKNGMLDYSLKGCKISALLFEFLAIPVFIQTPYLLKVWLVEVPEWSIIFVRLQLIRALVEQMCLSLQHSLNATNQIKELNLISCIYNLSPILILIFLYNSGFEPYWHYIVMTLVMTMGNGITLLLLCRRCCGLRISNYLKEVVFPCLLTMIVCILTGSVTLLISPGFLSLSICCVLTTITFSSFCWKMSSFHERESMKRMFCALLKKSFLVKFVNCF